MKPHPLHALIIGGTGMLWQVVPYLVEQGYIVSVIARRQSRIALRCQSSLLRQRVIPLPLDYHDTTALHDALQSSQQQYGPFSTAVCWVHSTAPEAMPTVLKILAVHATLCQVFHILGSASADPSAIPNPIRSLSMKYPTIRYHQVILGFVRQGNRSRWLTDAEISAGVITALQSDQRDSIVGIVTPWSLRP